MQLVLNAVSMHIVCEVSDHKALSSIVHVMLDILAMASTDVIVSNTFFLILSEILELLIYGSKLHDFIGQYDYDFKKMCLKSRRSDGLN